MDRLFTQDERGIVENIRRLDPPLRHRQFTIVQHLRRTDQPRIDWYGYSEHEDRIYRGMTEVERCRRRRRPFQPRDPRRRKAIQEDRIDEIPLEKKPERIRFALQELRVIPESIGIQRNVEGEDIEALLGRIHHVEWDERTFRARRL